MMIGVERKSKKTFKENKTNHPNHPLTLVILSLVGLALVACAFIEILAKPGSTTPAAPNVQKITLENAKQVSHLARLNEGSFTAQSVWSPDGRWLALPSAYGVYLFEAQTLNQVRFIEESEHVENISFSPDSEWLATSTRRAVPWHPETPTPLTDNTVRVWRISDGTLVHEFKGESWVGPAVFSPDNKYLATRSAQDTARLWQLSDGKMAREFDLKAQNDSDPLTRVVFSPDWNVAAIVSEGEQSNKTQVRIRLMRISDGSPLGELNEAEFNFDRAENLAFSSDGTMLISTNALFIENMIGQPRSGTRVNLWQVSDGRLVRQWEEQNVIFGVTVSPDGGWIALRDFEKTRIRRVDDGSVVRDINAAWDIVPSPDGKLIASRNEDHSLDGIFALRIWQVDDGSLEQELKEPFAVDGIAFSTDGSVLAAGRLWCVSNGALSNPVKLAGLADHVDSVAVSRDNQWIATGGMKNLRLWQANDGSLVREIEGITGQMNQVAFSPDGTWLASASTDDGVQLWQVSDGSLVRTFSNETNNVVTKLIFSPDGNLLASATRDTLQLWRVNDGILVREMQGGWKSISFSPDSKLMASTDAGGTLGLWQTSDGSLVRTLEVSDIVSGTAFSSDGRLLAVMYISRTLRLWQVSNGSLIREVEDQYSLSAGESIAFSQDETTLISAGSKKPNIGLWGIPQAR
jgi:WD40 repeat protein